MKNYSITYSGKSVSYAMEGSGFPLVFLHGFVEDHTIWEPFIDSFLDQYRVLLIDTPGFGKSDVMQDASMESYADCIKAILDHEKITECAMIGHSMGGYIMLNFASRFPGYLKGFGLFHSTSYPDDENKKKDRERVAEFVRKNGSEVFANELYGNLFGSVFKEAHPDRIMELKKYGANVSPAEGIAAASLAMRDRGDTTEVLRTSKVPVLFIIGKEDKAVNPEKTLTLTHLPAVSSIHILPGVGHMGMIEEKEKCQAAIQEWLELVKQ